MTCTLLASFSAHHRLLHRARGLVPAAARRGRRDDLELQLRRCRRREDHCQNHGKGRGPNVLTTA